MKIAIIIGTRPEAIKLIPVYRVLKASKEFEPVIISTGQHKEMLDSVWRLYNLQPDIELKLMTESQSLEELGSKLLIDLSVSLRTVKPSMVLVQGDTHTAFYGALASFYLKISVGHVEAGMRTEEKYNPFPEEINRRLISEIADLHFCATEREEQVLVRENIKGSIEVTGNTVIDNLLFTADLIDQNVSGYDVKYSYLKRPNLVLITLHRRESFGVEVLRIVETLKELAVKNENVDFVFPVHMNPSIRKHTALLEGADNFHLLEPLPYDSMVYLMKRSNFIITDSGGIQEEAPVLGKKVIVLREVTERMQLIESGLGVLVGKDVELLKVAFGDFLQNADKNVNHGISLFGDGKASERILAAIRDNYLNPVKVS